MHIHAKSARRPAVVLWIFVFIVLPCLFVGHVIRHEVLNRDLILAIKTHRDDRILALLRDGASGNARESNETSITLRSIYKQLLNRFFHKSSNEDNTRRSALLIYYETPKEGFDVPTDADDPKGPKENVALALLMSRAPINDSDFRRQSIIYWAVYFHHHKVVRRLIELGASVNVDSADAGESPLMAADAEDTRTLLEHGVHPNQQDSEGYTALFRANREKTVLLLDRHAATEVKNQWRQTPLLADCKDGNDASALVLIAHGASLSARDNFGSTPLIRAAESCKLETVEALAKAGADIRAKDKNGTTALIVSPGNSDTRVFFWLLGQGIDINARGIDGCTALSVARYEYGTHENEDKVKSQLRKMVKTLKTMGANPGDPAAIWYGEDGD
jgi:ankyrin repeat protein